MPRQTDCRVLFVSSLLLGLSLGGAPTLRAQAPKIGRTRTPDRTGARVRVIERETVRERGSLRPARRVRHRSPRTARRRGVSRRRRGVSRRRRGTTRRSASSRGGRVSRRARSPRRLRLPPMPLYHMHNRQRTSVRLYDHRGRLRAQAIRQFSRFMRCGHTGKLAPIHWRLLVVLYDLWMRFGQPQVSIVSGYRPSEVARLKTSKHVHGHAVDFAFDGVDNARVRDYLLANYAMVGVGYYPNGYHLHLDVRRKKRFWIDYAYPGRKAIYSRHPYADVRRRVARRGYQPPWARGRRKGAGRVSKKRSKSNGLRPARPPMAVPRAAASPRPAVRRRPRRPAPVARQ